MTSGNFTGPSFSGLSLYTEWTSVPDAASLSSSVRVKVYLNHRDIYCAALSGSYIKVGNEKYSFTCAVSESATSLKKTLLCDRTFTVKHDADGKKALSIFASWAFRGTYAGAYISAVTSSGTAVLDTLLPKSTITKISGGVLGEDMTVSLSRFNEKARHKVTVKISGESFTTGYLSGTSLSFTVPKTLAYGITSARSGVGTVTLETYSADGVAVGSDSRSVTLKIPDNDTFKPSFSLSVTPSSLSSYLDGREIYAAGLSKAVAVISEPSAVFGATVKSCELKLGAVSLKSQNCSFELLSGGAAEISASVTDSRGLVRTYKKEIEVFPYAAPYFTYVDAYRCDTDGVKNEKGTCLYVKSGVSVAAVDGENSYTVGATLKERGGTSVGKRNMTGGEAYIWDLSLSSAKSYVLSLLCRDSVGKAATFEVCIPTEKVDFHMKNGSVRFGGIIEKEGFDCSLDADFTGGFALGGNPVSDFITECGTDDVWTYRKWNSGISECFGMVDKRSYDLTKEYAGFYKGLPETGDTNSVSYPTGLFKSRPQVSLDAVALTDIVIPIKSNLGTNYVSPRVAFLSDRSGTHEIELYVHALGRYK